MQRNRLAAQTSPYLLQHADNPVDWYPWGEQALTAAKRDNKPILLSIGYSACHWCHVMAHESFEDPATAALMNRWFVNIKVDREERPDLDKIYQTAQQLITQRDQLLRRLVNLIQIRALFAVHFDVDEPAVHQCGGRRVFEGFVCHDV